MALADGFVNYHQMAKFLEDIVGVTAKGFDRDPVA